MLGRVQRHTDARHRADGLGPLAGAVDDDLALDVPGVGADAADASAPGGRGVLHHVEPGDPHAFPHVHAELAGALGEGLGQVGGVGGAVARQPDGADEVVGPQQRVRSPACSGVRSSHSRS